MKDNAKYKIQYRSDLWPTALMAERRFNAIFLRIRKDVPNIFHCSKGASALKEVVARRSYKAAKYIDYGLIGSAFVDAYLLKNLLKCLYAFSIIEAALPESKFSIPDRVIDVGSGPGTASIAWISTFPFAYSEILQIEPSEQQIRISREIWGSLFGGVPDFLNDRFQNWGGGPGVRLASYWLCGQKLDSLKSSGDLQKLLAEDLFAIDYREVLGDFATQAKGLAECKTFSISIELSDVHRKLIGERYLNLSFLHAVRNNYS